MIELENIGYSYGEKQVLENLSLQVGEGERIALMGPSGCGKTTLLNLLAGLTVPNTGRIRGLPADGVSMVFQENRLLPWLSTLDNLALVAQGRPRSELLALLEEVGLSGEQNTYPLALSGGMARRVAIARAVAFRRELYLLDEPFKGLDEHTRQAVLEFVNAHTLGQMLVLVTHDPGEAELLGCKRIQLESLQKKRG